MTNPDPIQILPLSEVANGSIILDPKRREGTKQKPKEGDLQCTIHLKGWKQDVYYDWDVEVRVLKAPRTFAVIDYFHYS